MTVPDRLIIGVGYLGLRVAKRWSLQGGRVFGTTRHPSRFAELTELGLSPIEWDVLSGEGELPAVDTVLFDVGYDRSQSVSRHDVYVSGLQRTLERLPRPRRFIYVSSTGVYGDHGGEWIDEKSPVAPMDESGRTCLAAEELLWDFANARGWDVVVLRFAGIYGPDRMLNAERVARNEPIAGDPDGWLNLIHVEDGAGVIEAAQAVAQPGETYLVSDGAPVQRRDFYGCLAEQVGAPAPVFDLSLPARHRGNRRISSRKMMEELAPRLSYPSYREGLAADV